MKSFWFVCIFISLCGCKLASTNSTAQDGVVYGALPMGDGTAKGNRYALAQNAIQKNCISCHSAFAMHSDTEWLNSGYITAGNPTGSTLFGRIRGSGVNGAPQNMPPSGNMGASDIAAVKDWIQNIAAIAAVVGDAASRTSSALTIFSVSCKSCHTSTRTANSTAYSGSTVPAFGNYTTDVEFYQSGLVFAGDPTNSWIYRSLKGHGDINKMPQNGSALPTASADSIYDWISKLGEP